VWIARWDSIFDNYPVTHLAALTRTLFIHHQVRWEMIRPRATNICYRSMVMQKKSFRTHLTKTMIVGIQARWFGIPLPWLPQINYAIESHGHYQAYSSWLSVILTLQKVIQLNQIHSFLTMCTNKSYWHSRCVVLIVAEPWAAYYDIFVRNSFGSSFFNLLKEVAFSPLMGKMLTYEGKSTSMLLYWC